MKLENQPTRMVTDPVLSMQYLQTELARIDILIHREIRRWQLAGQNMEDNFRGLYVSDTDANALLKRPFASSWGQSVLADADDDAVMTMFEQANGQSRYETAVRP